MVVGLRSQPPASPGLRVISPSEVHGNLAYDALIEALRAGFRAGYTIPEPAAYEVPGPGRIVDASLLFSPAWNFGKNIGVSIRTLFPDNADSQTRLTQNTYLLLDGKTGALIALIDGHALTLRRTAATSALAASYLARPDSERLLLVGTGELAAHLLEAHTKTRPICNVLVWGRDFGKAQRLAHRLDRRRLKVAATDDLEKAVKGANIVCCATSATAPLIRGEWLQEGVHLDLVGSMTPDMREVDDDCIKRARIWLDSREGVFAQGGDIIQPIENGTLNVDEIRGDLTDLSRGNRPGRQYYDQVTLFKSVGTPVADLAAASLLINLIEN